MNALRSIVVSACLILCLQESFGTPAKHSWRSVDSENLEILQPYKISVSETHLELSKIEEEVLQGIKNFDKDWAGRNIFVVRFNYVVLDEETQQYELERVLEEDLVYDSSSSNITSFNGIKRFIGSKVQESVGELLQYVDTDLRKSSAKRQLSKQKNTDVQKKVNFSYMESYDSFDLFSEISQLREMYREYELRFKGRVHFFDFNTTQDEIVKNFRTLLNYTGRVQELIAINERLSSTYTRVSDGFSRKAQEKYMALRRKYESELTGIDARLTFLRDNSNPLKSSEEDYYKRVRESEDEFDAFRKDLDFDKVRTNEILYQLWHSEQKFISDLRRQFNLPEEKRFFKTRDQITGKKRVFFMINVHSRFDICGDACGPGLLATCSPFGEFAEKIRGHFKQDFAFISSFRQFRNQWTGQEVEIFKKEAASDIREEKFPYFPALYVGDYSEVQSEADTVTE